MTNRKNSRFKSRSVDAKKGIDAAWARGGKAEFPIHRVMRAVEGEAALALHEQCGYTLVYEPSPPSQLMDFLAGPGTQAALRSYWTNSSFTANVINDVPHESRLEPHEWGRAMLE